MPKLLIVEDDQTISFMVREVLRHEGFETTAIAEGSDALDALRADPYDIVLLDVMLPGVDGISILRAIREDPALSHIAVVLLTARSDDSSTWEGWKAGCDLYLSKPFDPDELVAALDRLVSERSAAAALASEPSGG
jgi:DNA-binding response OmpR family regulator